MMRGEAPEGRRLRPWPESENHPGLEDSDRLGEWRSEQIIQQIALLKSTWPFPMRAEFEIDEDKIFGIYIDGSRLWASDTTDVDDHEQLGLIFKGLYLLHARGVDAFLDFLYS